jgi:hypothetical protein
MCFNPISATRTHSAIKDIYERTLAAARSKKEAQMVEPSKKNDQHTDPAGEETAAGPSTTDSSFTDKVRPFPAADPAKTAAGLSTTDTGGAPSNLATKVAEVFSGGKDGRGEKIDFVYFKRESYAIYLSGPNVVVAHSDVTADATQQIILIAPLIPLRERLTYLTKDLPQKGTRESYCSQIADALRLGLEKQADAAKLVIEEAVRDAQETQARIGRMVYLQWAAGVGLIVAGLLIMVGGAHVPNRSGVSVLLMATGAGAVGALWSISIGIRARTVAIDGNGKANALDAALRVLIGIISAAVLFLLLSSGVLTDIQAGTVKFTGAKIQWQVALLVGFIAGFLERLVPDLLEKSAPRTAAPAPGTGVVSPGR